MATALRKFVAHYGYMGGNFADAAWRQAGQVLHDPMSTSFYLGLS
jgi:hypothetical protein